MKNTYQKECGYCENHFSSSNYRKKYCCATCKTYASHERNGKLNEAQVYIKKQKEDKFLVQLLYYFTPAFDDDGNKKDYKLLDRLCQFNPVIKNEDQTYQVTSTSIGLIRYLKDKFDCEVITKDIAVNLNPNKKFPLNEYKCYSIIIKNL